ncbi:MAG: hypothetical protein CM15mV13_2950 [uncultured marine virus]|nr:MAG: hypothetical protein CM15mV13_2950 [uncultured marine virus]
MAYDKDHYALVELAPTAGTLIDIESNLSFNSTGTPRTSLTVSGLTGVSTVRLVASVSKNSAEKKLKNATQMEVMKVEKTATHLIMLNMVYHMDHCMVQELKMKRYL